MLPSLEQTNLGLVRAGIRESTCKRAKEGTAASCSPSWHSGLQGIPHRSPPHQGRGCSNISSTELHTKATNEEMEFCHPHAISVTAHVPTCEPRPHSSLGNSFNELRKKLTHFVAGFCPLWDTTLSALKEPGSLRHCQAPNDFTAVALQPAALPTSLSHTSHSNPANSSVTCCIFFLHSKIPTCQGL